MLPNLTGSEYVVRAAYSDRTIRVYQAYSPEIAIPALTAGRFVPPFKMQRMTWLKTSFNWMMYRSGFATKPGQEVVLGIDLTREGFDWALEHAVLSTLSLKLHSSRRAWKNQLRSMPVRIQWDPERDCWLKPIAGARAIQIGLSREAVARYVNEWITALEDVTTVARTIEAAIQRRTLLTEAPSQFERPYPLSATAARTICPG